MTKYNMLLKKVNQTGSMMIEALAMLTLISLVTPTLYKKSAERTTELQDINTATQVRTLSKAVDNYTLTNYQALLKELPEDGEGHISLTAQELDGYLPYGDELKPTKNFDTPTVIVKRQEGTDSLTSFVILPKVGDINDYRASQIASMVGANGGYITEEDGETKAKGVGGVWGLSQQDLQDMLGDANIPERGTLVTASSESINSASRQEMENTKYLQRTKENDGDEWRNTMMTDLYMGGVPGLLQTEDKIPLSKILGVDQLIIGGITTDALGENADNSDFVVRAYDGKPGSAFIEGSLYALGNAFTVSNNGEGNPELNFSNDLLRATKDHFSISTGDERTQEFVIGDAKVHDVERGKIARFNLETVVDENFEATGDTVLASHPDENSVLKVGPDGKFITADKNVINLQEGNVVIDNGLMTEESSSMLIATDKLNIKGTTKISNTPEDEEKAPLRDDLNLMLNVQGDAFVSDTLEAGEIDAHKFDTLKLYAGGTNYEKEHETDDHYIRWLNVDETGVAVKDLSEERLARMVINDTESTIYGPAARNHLNSVVGQGSLVIDNNKADLQGYNVAYVRSTNEEGQVQIQDGAIVAKNVAGKQAETGIANQVQIHATKMQVYGNDTSNTGGVAFEVQPGEGSPRSGSYVKADVDQFYVQKDDKKLLNIVSGENGTSLKEDSVVEIDPNKFRIWANSTGEDVNNRVFEVNASAEKGGQINDNGELSNMASVYVRRGAIEIEGSPKTSAEYAADEGVGYIEASRFVSNNLETDGKTVVKPRFSNGSGYDSAEKYDRYMVNPAYTSVMHDIKLTTRGGARLSDILPDFINKGIYIVNNTYQDGVNFNNLTVSNNGGKITANGVREIEEGDTFNAWASPFMGMVPAPQCPPGHARVITLTPASFQMGQAGDLIKNRDGRYYVSDGIKQENIDVLDNLTAADSQGNQMVQTPMPLEAVLQRGVSDTDYLHMYYLGMAPDTMVSSEPSASYTSANTAKPLYFQQSTWLKSKVVAYSTGPCTGSQASNGGCDNFMGWATVMGFIYPYKIYKPVIEALEGTARTDVAATNDNLVGTNDENRVYWNVFPVRPRSMEAYATVYCYFDRTNIFGSGNNGDYVDQYDQMNNFRSLGSKIDAGTRNQGNNGTNRGFIDRLNDPQLKYNDPW